MLQIISVIKMTKKTIKDLLSCAEEAMADYAFNVQLVSWERNRIR